MTQIFKILLPKTSLNHRHHDGNMRACNVCTVQRRATAAADTEHFKDRDRLQPTSIDLGQSSAKIFGQDSRRLERALALMFS